MVLFNCFTYSSINLRALRSIPSSLTNSLKLLGLYSKQLVSRMQKSVLLSSTHILQRHLTDAWCVSDNQDICHTVSTVLVCNLSTNNNNCDLKSCTTPACFNTFSYLLYGPYSSWKFLNFWSTFTILVSPCQMHLNIKHLACGLSYAGLEALGS